MPNGLTICLSTLTCAAVVALQNARYYADWLENALSTFSVDAALAELPDFLRSAGDVTHASALNDSEMRLISNAKAVAEPSPAEEEDDDDGLPPLIAAPVSAVHAPLQSSHEQPVAEQPVVEQPVAEQSVAEQPVAEQPVAEQPVAEQPVVEQPVVEQPVVEQPVAEQPMVEQPVAEQPVVEQPVVEHPIVEQPVVEQPIVEQPVVEQPVVEQPVVEQPVVEQPVVEQPVVEQPVVEQPEAEQPVVEQPVVEQPVVEQPVVEQPVVEQPVVEQPVVEQPVVEQPVVEQPVVEQPIGEQPEAEQPVVEQPVVDQPVVEQPVVEQPVVEQPVVDQPVVDQPVVEQPVAEQPVVEQPVAEQPVAEQPVAEQPVVEQPVAEQPVVEQPVVEQPVVEQPVVEQPVVEQPVVEQPVAEQPVVEQPVVEQPVVEQPVVEQPVVEQPVVEQPVAEQPVAEQPVVAMAPEKKSTSGSGSAAAFGTGGPPAEPTPQKTGAVVTAVSGSNETPMQDTPPMRCRVMLVGDSLMEDLGPMICRRMNTRKGMDFVVSAKFSTGLCRPDRFNWADHLREQVAKRPPDLVVFFMGANDGMPIREGRRYVPTGGREWKEAYMRRIDELVTIARGSGADVIWVEMPAVGGSYNKLLHDNQMAQREYCETHGVTTMRTDPLFSDEWGKFEPFGTYKGKTVRLRTKDLTHMTTAGNNKLLDHLMPIIEQRLMAFYSAHPERHLTPEQVARIRKVPVVYTCKYEAPPAKTNNQSTKTE